MGSHIGRHAWLWFWIWLAGMAFAGCGVVQFGYLEPEPTPMPASQIVFVTVTPPSPTLNEGERFEANAEPAPTIVSTPRSFYPYANERGKILVLEYHRIGYPETRYQRTPENFRADLERLHAEGYYPINFIDMLEQLQSVPAGKKPVILTFDDSDISQFRILDNDTIDADSGVGILLNFHDRHPEEWPRKATFFVLGDDSNQHSKVFGQSKWAKAKVRFLVQSGFEVGSHTVNHTDLSVATAERIAWELAISKHVIEEMAPGYIVKTMSVPYGGFPYTLDFLKAGEWEGFEYQYVGNVAAWGGPALSPYHPEFDAYRVARLEVTATSLDHWLTYFQQYPEQYYVSDGDPSRITFPRQELADSEVEE